MKRPSSPSNIYIAAIDSLSGVYKVGCSINPKARLAALKSEYGISFTLIEYILCDDPFSVESSIHCLLLPYIYESAVSNKKQTGHEIFECSIEKIRKAVDAAIEFPKLFETQKSAKSANFGEKNRLSDLKVGERFFINRYGSDEHYIKLVSPKKSSPNILNLNSMTTQNSTSSKVEITLVDVHEYKLLNKIAIEKVRL
jgi:hypothetical protein